MAYCANWVKQQFKTEVSPLGEQVAEFLNVLAAGIYHLDYLALKKVEWSNGQYMSINIWRSGKFATYDFDWLTRIVVLSHDRCIRVEIEPSSPKTLRLYFHKRERDGDSVSTRMPSLENHVSQIRAELVDWE